jgi:hypothetical protein
VLKTMLEGSKRRSITHIAEIYVTAAPEVRYPIPWGLTAGSGAELPDPTVGGTKNFVRSQEGRNGAVFVKHSVNG